MKFVSIVFFLFILFLTSCKKESPHYSISENMKQYFVYKKGSWWIYINDLSKVTDSTYLTDVFFSTQGIGSDGKTSFSSDLIGSSFKSKFLMESEIINDCDQKMTKLYLGLGDGINITFNPIAYADGIPLNTTYLTQCGRPYGDLFVEMIASDTINEKIFLNIIHSRLKYSELSGTINNIKVLHFYFVKNAGLIKYQYILNDSVCLSWSLKKYSVIQ